MLLDDNTADAAKRIQSLQRGKSERTVLAAKARERAVAYGNKAQLEHFTSSVVNVGGTSYEMGGAAAAKSASRTAPPLPACRHGAACTDHTQRHRSHCSHPLNLEAELAPIIGLDSVKKQLLGLQESVRIDIQRRRDGMPVPPQKPLHMVFTGSPGSGKTLIGQLVGRLLHELGATQGSAFVEVQRTDLVGSVIGATALATRARVDEAKGGVIFIDEAYRLTSSGSHKDFGREALEELMRDMTSGDPVVIVAGYPKEMQTFLAANAGMESRFGFVLHFPDYSPLELAQIFAQKAYAEGFTLSSETRPAAIAQAIEEATSPSWRALRNGGVADVLFRRVAEAQDRRLLAAAAAGVQISLALARLLERADIEQACAGLETRRESEAELQAERAAGGGMQRLPGKEGKLQAALEAELDTMVGLWPVKAALRALPTTLYMEGLRRSLGAPCVGRSLWHCVFMGRPGVGKTKVARFLGKALHRLGAVSSDRFVEVQRSDLVGDKVGQTGKKTRERIEEAKGGVLFVDEAYTLTVQGSDKDFGREAVDEIMRDMLSGDPVVVIAGYPEEMASFLAANAGLARRFEHTLTFPDYTASEIGQIFALKAKEAGFSLADELQDGSVLGGLLEQHTSEEWRGSAAAGNARVAERTYHLAYEALTRRHPQATTFLREDITNAASALGEISRQWDERQQA